jgi:hypothetical protein
MRGREPCGARFRNSRHVPVVDFQRGTGSVGPHAFTYSVVKQRCLDVACKEAKQNRPLFAALGLGVALIPLFPLPRNRGGWRADKAQCPDYSGRGVRLTPDVGCTTVHPRLAARQRGILAFMPLTVVGPGRLLVADEAARVRPGDEGCVSPSLAGAAPVPRLQNASGRRPSNLDRDRLTIITLEVKSSIFSLLEYFSMVNRSQTSPWGPTMRK